MTEEKVINPNGEGFPEDAVGPRVLLMGPPGSGKTHSVMTALDAGLKVYGLFLEKHHTALKVVKDHPNKDNFFYMVVKDLAPTSGPSSLLKVMKALKKVDNSDLQKQPEVLNQKFNGLEKFLEAAANFIDQHGVSHGDVTNLGNDCFVFIDSMSGINEIIRDYYMGGKLIISQPDYGRLMTSQTMLLRDFLFNCQATLCFLAHVVHSDNELTNRSQISPDLIGKKNNGRICRWFSDVIYTSNSGGNFTWQTTGKDMDLKSENLPIKSGLKPSFVPLIENWREAVHAGIAPTKADLDKRRVEQEIEDNQS